MEKGFSNSMKYLTTSSEIWQGRSSESGKSYWHENVIIKDLKNIGTEDFGVIGYCCDEGVRRNHGRIGAKKSPASIREKLSKLAWHHNEIRVADFGDLVLEDENLEAFQVKFSDMVTVMITSEIFPIVLGGGHDVAWAHFEGLKKSEHLAGKNLGIINFDAHFDLRGGNIPTSGTPFRQILEKYPGTPYLAIGIQPESNIQELFNSARDYNVRYILAEDCHQYSIKKVNESIRTFLQAVDKVYVTVDMDGFSSAYAPGVSAPSPVGIDPNIFFYLIQSICDSGKLISMDIAETNPNYDLDGRTTSLAARIVNKIVGSVS